MVPSWASYDTWNVGIAALEHPLRNIRELHPLRNIRWLPPRPPLYLLADPFPYRHHGRDWLLVEAYGHPKSSRGHIARLDPDDPASAAAPQPVIVRNKHISYPYTFVDGVDVYCVPEMSQEEGCVLYRLDEDGRWVPRHHLLRGVRIVDPTIFRFAARWWLFCAEPPPHHTRTLHAYFADALDGPWTPHPLNPLKRDVASSRPAGRPFTIGDRLYRPAQDCHETYGGAVHVMEVLTLTTVDFRETVALRLESDAAWPYPDGLHHLVVDGTRVYFDAKRRSTDFLLPFKARR
jgi:hypothetical protein